MNVTKVTVLTTVIGTLACLRSAQAADITGTVTFKGTPPPEAVIDKSSSEGCAAHGAKSSTHHYVVGPNGEFANVTIWVKGFEGKGKSTGASAPPVVLDQKDCEYTPVIMAVQTGQKILVKNSDPTTHNVHANPGEGSANTPSNQIQPPGSPDLTLVFDKPEMFLKISCEVHNWMFSWVSIFDHPYFAVSAKDGSFKISGLPPGKYTIVAQHRKANNGKPLTQEIEVKEGAPNKVEFLMSGPTPKSA